MAKVVHREKYIRELSKLFREEGIALTVEQIAQRLGVTKMTLYNNFKSKCEMIDSVLASFKKHLRGKIEKGAQYGDNAIVQLIRIANVVEKEISTKLKSKLLTDVLKEHKPLFMFSSQDGLYYNVLKDNLLKGIKDGFYRPVADIETTLFFYTSSLDYIYSYQNFTKFERQLKRLFRRFTICYIYSIVNEKGRKYFENYLDKS